MKEWVEKTIAIGLKATTGRYGGTYVHSDIAFEFGMWISAEFKVYLIKEFHMSLTVPAKVFLFLPLDSISTWGQFVPM